MLLAEARADAQDLVQRCVGCQLFANQSHMPPTTLQTIPITWPFAVWGLDMVGPLKGETHKQKYLLVMVDKFTKWIEALRSGGLTWLDPLKEEPTSKHIYWSWWTNSPNG